MALGLTAVVVVNKIDRKDADPQRALNETFDLFIELGATEEQTDFPVVYCQAVKGIAGTSPETMTDNLQPLFDLILRNVPPPDVDMDAPFQMLVANLGYDSHLGTTCLGRIFAGTVKEGQEIARIKINDEITTDKVKYLFVFDGLDKKRVDTLSAGDIAFIAGVQEINIGETFADKDNPIALPKITVEEPTVKMSFEVNNSPFSGRSGKYLTTRQLRERLYRELRNNVALKVEDTEFADRFIVSGRGELHLAILIETMRREGYEFQVSRPEVIYKKDDAGNLLEPFEEVVIETLQESVGSIVELLGSRRGQLNLMENQLDGVLLNYTIPTRGILGLRQIFMTLTRGQGIMHTIFGGYRPYAGEIPSRSTSSLVAWEMGTATTYGLKNAEERGTLFISAGIDVYEGMVIGETMKNSDITVNVSKKKHLTNMRSANKDLEYRLNTPKQMSLDEALEFLAEDELLEITPDNYRIRKRILNTEERGKAQKSKQKNN